MLDKELINRLVKVLPKLEYNLEYFEKYFEKLKLESEIQDYNVLGISNLTDSVIVDVTYNDNIYRINKQTDRLTIVSQEEDVFSVQLQ